jgi:hypothetical protein
MGRSAEDWSVEECSREALSQKLLAKDLLQEGMSRASGVQRLA